MKLRIDLLRHGETTLSHTLRGSTDDALTALGWQQMQQTIDQAVQRAGSMPWRLLFSSPLQRCAKFTEALVEQFDLSMTLNADLQEMHFGDWEGTSTAQIYADEPELLANFWQYPTQYNAPNGETLAHFQARILSGLAQIYQQMKVQQAEHALIVTHGGVIKLLKCLALQQPLDDLLKMTAELGQLSCFEVDVETLQLQLIEAELVQMASEEQLQ
ncbi:histidine phosphatase family protein [Acinetobacter sp. TY1]|uniref:histidine phosphatase family protein n=1 Tax=unclassified Acinetobacter TaxID=196816 RepID=UPI00302EAB23